MKTELLEIKDEEILKPLDMHADARPLWSRLSSLLVEMKATTILRFYRLVSVVLCTILLLIFPGRFEMNAQISLIILVSAVSILMVSLYEHFWRSYRITLSLILFETAAISWLLASTGGFHGPFLWYALNPFVVATAFYPVSMAVILLLVMLTGTLFWKAYFFADTVSLAEIFQNNYFSALNLVVLVMIMHLFARMHMTIAEQSEAKRNQQHELISAYQGLSANYAVLKGLSDFQKQAVSYKNQMGLYSALTDSLLRLFPLKGALMIIPPPRYWQVGSSKNSSFQIIDRERKSDQGQNRLIMEEIERKWENLMVLGQKRIYISENRQWIAVPLLREKGVIDAVFVGILKPQVNPVAFADDISLFVRFAEQSTAWLSLFKQKEQVLQHISSIYEAVGAAASTSNPYAVTKLFASYAMSLTGCEKAIFWIEDSGDENKEDYSPIYTIKGPKDVFPEEEWQKELLMAWQQIQEQGQPVVLDIKSADDSNPQMIAVPIKSSGRCIGMLAGIQTSNTYSVQEISQTLSILGDLGAIAVARNRAEAFAERALVIDEQKRIANEIHDTISQNLFSIVYSIDTLMREQRSALDENSFNCLADIKDVSAETGRELRALIYRLNPKQEKNESFIEEVSGYLEQVARMYQLKVVQEIKGGSEYLNPAMCKTLYRILKEATGNAVRHSECNVIRVTMEITPFNSTLTVYDNGNGFNAESSLDLYAAGNRLGLVNMRELAMALRGTLSIDSNPDMGTTVTCSIPTSPVSLV